jgi:hypothetical protein
MAKMAANLTKEVTKNCTKFDERGNKKMASNLMKERWRKWRQI